MSATTFHVSNYGSFRGHIPSDLDGYAHTTQSGWMRAPMDWGTEYSARGARSARLERCGELAAQTRAAVRAADKALADWRNK